MRILFRVFLLVSGFFILLKPLVTYAESQNEMRLKITVENILGIAFNYGPESFQNNYSLFFSDTGWKSFLESYESQKNLLRSDWLVLISANEPFHGGFHQKIESGNDGSGKSTKIYETNIEIIFMQDSEETKKYMAVELTSNVERKNREIINHRILIDKVNWVSPFQTKNLNSAP